MRYVIESLYRSMREGSAVSLPYREILRTARIMDAIFDQSAVRDQPRATRLRQNESVDAR